MKRNKRNVIRELESNPMKIKEDPLLCQSCRNLILKTLPLTSTEFNQLKKCRCLGRGGRVWFWKARRNGGK